MAIIVILVLVGLILTWIDEKSIGKAFTFVIGIVVFGVLTVYTGGLFLFFGKAYLKILMNLVIS